MISRKPKRPKAAWTRAFPKQAQALSPERSASGGIKARGASEKVRMEVYNGIRVLFMEKYPICQKCGTASSTDIHHTKARLGWYLVDVRYWQALCRSCHSATHNNPPKATEPSLTQSQP